MRLDEALGVVAFLGMCVLLGRNHAPVDFDALDWVALVAWLLIVPALALRALRTRR